MAVEYSHLFIEFNVILGCGLTSEYQANSMAMVKNAETEVDIFICKLLWWIYIRFLVTFTNKFLEPGLMKVNNDDFILFSDHLSKCSACLGKLSHSNQ